MRIDKPGRYVLTEDVYTRGAFSCATIPAGTTVEITQVDAAGGKVIGPMFEDWHRWDIPAREDRERWQEVR